MSPSHYRLLAFIFTLSGFAGLIYESIWSHYLQLLLGHAAYAQTMVLVIFMGGMALGSRVAARRISKHGDLLIRYALIEGALAAFALIFHRLFIASDDLLHEIIIPNLDTPLLIHMVKWAVGAILILPQSILLGMTFPVMCSAILRQRPDTAGATVSTLYFCNSLGAAVGVLVSGFWLIDKVGLPGTIMTAGLINAGIALSVWGLFRLGLTDGVPTGDNIDGVYRHSYDPWYRPLLIISALTGLSSFIYEISWIRMLSMVLGSATQSFELMLSAFILGLALGGLWLRKRLDHINDLLVFLAAVQIIMGAAALMSMAVYGQSFEAMKWLLGAIQHSPNGYVLHLVLSNLLVLAVMLPTTFCAGMTLPLITYTLLRRGRGERSIGQVYAVNTVGAILGVLFAVHIGMPLLGLKGAMMAGAILDVVIGLAIVFTGRARYPAWHVAGTMVFGIGVIAATSIWVKLDPYQMASGVYRSELSSLPASIRMLFNKDGKTATINVREMGAGMRTISTNGKPDASIAMRPGSSPSVDEVTMIMIAALPLALHPSARIAANIGMGSGLTTSTLLASTHIQRVDTVEIEAAMVEGAENFRPRVERTYTDPRSHIYIDDAKTFFASHGERYDIVVSEPSNPWVSGVASLFTDEFYQHIRRHLNPDGLYVQWLQIYETDIGLVASVMKALNRNFPDYVVYVSDDGNLIIVASQDRKLSDPDGSIFDQPLLTAELNHVGISNLRELQLHRIGNKRLLGTFFDAYGEPLNSDYFPYLDLHANRSRFLMQNSVALVSLSIAPIPMLRWLDITSRWDNLSLSVPAHTLSSIRVTAQAEVLANALIDGGVKQDKRSELSPDILMAVDTIISGQHSCTDPEHALAWLQSARKILSITLPLLSSELSTRSVNVLGHSACAPLLSGEDGKWLELFEAVGHADLEKSAVLAVDLLRQMDARHAPERDLGYAVALAMSANLAMNKPQDALEIWEQHVAGRGLIKHVDVYLQLLHAMAVHYSTATHTVTLQ